MSPDHHGPAYVGQQIGHYVGQQIGHANPFASLGATSITLSRLRLWSQASYRPAPTSYTRLTAPPTRFLRRGRLHQASGYTDDAPSQIYHYSTRIFDQLALLEPGGPNRAGPGPAPQSHSPSDPQAVTTSCLGESRNLLEQAGRMDGSEPYAESAHLSMRWL